MVDDESTVNQLGLDAEGLGKGIARHDHGNEPDKEKDHGFPSLCRKSSSLQKRPGNQGAGGEKT